MEFYLARLLEAYHGRTVDEVKAAMNRWEADAPNPGARRKAMDLPFLTDCNNLILHGSTSGTGKTTVAHEVIWRAVTNSTGCVHVDEVSPLVVTGFEFARRISEAAKFNSLSDYLDPICAASHLVIDDIDKRGASDGKFSDTVQQALFDIIEQRTSRIDDVTILTLNSTGKELLKKFDDNIGPYLGRRLLPPDRGGRFGHVNFDT